LSKRVATAWLRLSRLMPHRAGGDCLADVGVVRAQSKLFGPVASDPTVSRLVARLAAGIEVGVGFAYFPVAPGPDASIATAEGDAGIPTRQIGDGWWWVQEPETSPPGLASAPRTRHPQARSRRPAYSRRKTHGDAG
jgi:hypothetical protein